MKKPKYGNKKVVVDGISFDSKKEAVRYGQLKLLLNSGHIADLRLQVPFILVEGVKFNGEARKKKAITYKADFVYFIDGIQIIEDVKGYQTDVYRIKKHLMKSLLGLEIREV